MSSHSAPECELDVADVLRRKLLCIPDYPKPGVTFRDVAPILRDPASFASVMAAFRAHIAALGCTCVVGIESRGYLIGAPLALLARVKFVAVRKPRRMPVDTVSVLVHKGTFSADRLEITTEALLPSDRVVIVDDVIGTGATAEAAANLVEVCGATVLEIACVAELPELRGRERLARRSVFVLAAAVGVAPDPASALARVPSTVALDA